MHAVVVHPAGADTRRLLDAVRAVPGIDSVVPILHELHAVAVIRTLRPDVILLHADGCTDDTSGLLDWLRVHAEASRTVLIRLEVDAPSPSRLAHITGVPLLVLPRDRIRLTEMLDTTPAGRR